MKKILSIILCSAVVLTTGCSSVSQEEYNSVFEEKTSLKYENENLQNEIDSLQQELDTLKSENSELTQEIDVLNRRLDDTSYCFDICTWVLGRPQTALQSSDVSYHDDAFDIETTYYIEGSEATAKTVNTINSKLSAASVASYIESSMEFANNDIENFFLSGFTEYMMIYRYDDGNVIASQFWYKENGEIQSKAFLTHYGLDIASYLSVMPE